MAISRCSRCGHLVEHDREAVGTMPACPQCRTATPVYDTIYFVTELLRQFQAARIELQTLRAAAPVAPPAAVPGAAPAADFDLHNSNRLSSPERHRAIVEWFRGKGIGVEINSAAVDTTGFFDEAAVAIGDDFETLGEVCERIRNAQLRDYHSVVLHLDKRTPEVAAALVEFGRELHRYSLVSRYFHNRDEQSVRLVLQNAPSVRKFFAGEWLEWYALMVGLRLNDERGRTLSCARNLTLTIGNDERRELDVFFLLDGRRPIYVECKTGEYRQDLDKYVALRKRLAIDSRSFIICVADMAPEQAKGLSAMYDMSFVNTQTLGPHLASLLAA